jgi:hypothetical protein
MAIVRRFGAEQVQALAAQAGQAQAKAREADVKLKQRFQKDMAMLNYNMELFKQQKAMQWETEKMELASRLDFEQSERRRRQKQETFASGIEQIERRFADGLYPREVMERALTEFSSKFDPQDVPDAGQYLGMPDPAEQRRMAAAAAGASQRQAEHELDIAKFQQGVKEFDVQESRRLQELAVKFLGQFVEDVEIDTNPGFWNIAKMEKFKLAKRSDPKDLDSRLIPATEAETLMYDILKSQLEQSQVASTVDPGTTTVEQAMMEPMEPQTPEELLEQTNELAKVNLTLAKERYERIRRSRGW